MPAGPPVFATSGMQFSPGSRPTGTSRLSQSSKHRRQPDSPCPPTLDRHLRPEETRHSVIPRGNSPGQLRLEGISLRQAGAEAVMRLTPTNGALWLGKNGKRCCSSRNETNILSRTGWVSVHRDWPLPLPGNPGGNRPPRKLCEVRNRPSRPGAVKIRIMELSRLLPNHRIWRVPWKRR